MNIFSSLWDAVWWLFTIFVFVAYLIALFSIISDLVRDRDLNGWAKAGWLLFLIFLPFLTALAYIIVRGQGMAETADKQLAAQREATEGYIRSVAGGTTTEIAQAKQLLDNGTISPSEYEALKARILSPV
ncbi:SHOCT domain-containing protein [Flaviflexus massiliensis]|uniref:SHOCT domain-containing protein n=1 Tax=Flaviflexus massiliensis TaxID=1522309 RepID=UPI0006D579D7|nr:SHOCT domain-containing protein [Flaviflexus massiliensis]